MPGGSPLHTRSSRKRATTASSSATKKAASSGRACKYGPRGEDGKCPKKPKGPKKPKKPCKYGPRDANGRCPKKPSSYSSSSSSGESSSWLDKPLPTTTRTGRKTTTTARKAITKGAEEVARKAADETFNSLKKWYAKPENRATLASKTSAAVSFVKSAAPWLASALAIFWAARPVLAMTAQRLEQDAQNFASLQIANTTRLAKRALTIAEATTLRDFYRKQYLNSYNLRIGK